MKIIFISVGQIKKPFIKEGVAEYFKRIGRYLPVEAAEVKEERCPPKAPKDDANRKEGERIKKRLKEGCFKIALDERGEQLTSNGLARLIETRFSGGGVKGVAFVVGGAYGLHKDVTDAADFTLSLSRMTLPHEMALLVLAEQVYRAFTIIRNEPYSH